MRGSKTIKQSEWNAWPVIADPAFISSQIRRDPLTGIAWSWVRSGKRVEIRLPFDAQEGK